jgi:hypothetical protein
MGAQQSDPFGRPPRTNSTFASGRSPGSRAGTHIRHHQIRAFPCFAQWHSANPLLVYRCGGSVGVIHLLELTDFPFNFEGRITNIPGRPQAVLRA